MQLPYSNLKLEFKNAEAENKLILPVHLICNTSDEQIYNNIKLNSEKHNKDWIKCSEEHEGIALIIGSAPSILDNFGLINELQQQGAKIFAMNNAANILYENCIYADYQVILDARVETTELIGPANEYLFASQVHPKCFELKPEARLWHLQVGNIEDHFPEYEEGYALIGGAASVGNTTTCLAYAMGYRDLRVFGMDSSHKNGVSHAKHQKINDGDPCALVAYNGKEYLCSLTMKLQAERFQETSKALEDCGAKITVYGEGLLPDMWRCGKDEMSEYNKYTLMWNQPEYRAGSPGHRLVGWYLFTFKPYGKIIDFGCGLGWASLEMHRAGLDVLLLDFTTNSRDGDKVYALPFAQQDLTKPIPYLAKFGFCTDVMEHLPTEDVEKTIDNIMEAAEEVFFQISTIPEGLGDVIGQTLHLTVKPYQWWYDLFIAHGYKITWSMEQEIAALFYVVNPKVAG